MLRVVWVVCVVVKHIVGCLRDQALLGGWFFFVAWH
jgi:hypothetical protein